MEKQATVRGDRRNIYIPDEVYREAKVNAFRQGISLHQYVTEALRHENERYVDLTVVDAVQQYPLGKRIVRDGVPHVYVKAGEDINMNDAVQEERAEK